MSFMTKPKYTSRNLHSGPEEAIRHLARGTMDPGYLERHSLDVPKRRFYRATTPGLKVLEPSNITYFFDGVYLTTREASAILYRRHDLDHGRAASLYRCELNDVRLFDLRRKARHIPMFAHGFGNFLGNLSKDIDSSYMELALLDKNWSATETEALLTRDRFSEMIGKVWDDVSSGNPVRIGDAITEVTGLATEYVRALGFDGTYDYGTGFCREYEALVFDPKAVRILGEERLTLDRLKRLERRLDGEEKRQGGTKR
jgi:hypothetical protein